MDMKDVMMEDEQKGHVTVHQIGQVEQKTHQEPHEHNNSEKAHRENDREIDKEENHENDQMHLPPSRPVIALKRIIKQQHVWGFNENYTFRKLDPPDLLEKCPSCGAGPIKWSAIRNKRNNNSVSRLRCNRQAKGTCDYRGALRRTERKRMMRAAANANKSRLSQPIDQACNMMKDAVRLLQLANKTTLFTYISRNEIPAQIRAFMMQFLADSPGDAIPEMIPPQLFLSSATAPDPEPTPLQRLALVPQPKALGSKSHRDKPTPSLWNLNAPTDTFSPFESGRIGRFSAGIGLDVGAGMNRRRVNPQITDMPPSVGLGSGWNSSSLDFKPLSLNTGASSKSSSSLDMMGMMTTREEANSLNQLALEAARTTTPLTAPRRNRKRDLNEKHNSLPPKKAVYADSALDPPRTLPMATARRPPMAQMAQSRATSTFGHLANQLKPEAAHMTMCPCCLNSVSPAERFCMVCGACLQWT